MQNVTSGPAKKIAKFLFGLGATAALAANALAAPLPDPVLTISIPTEVTLGSTATIIVNAKDPSTNANIVGLPIQHVRVDYPSIDPITSLPIVVGVMLVPPTANAVTDTSGNVSVLFDPAALEIPANCTTTIRAQSEQVVGSWSGAVTVSIEFCIKSQECGAPFTFALTDVTGPGELLVSTKTTKYSGEWYLTYTVKACTEIVAGTKVQGGAVAWALYGGATADVGAVTATTKNKNTVITWVLPALAAGTQESIVVKVSGNSSTVVGTQQLSGAWSAVYQTLAEANYIDPITNLSAPISAHKSDYTPRATYQVVNVLTP
jgi:hypothetical protein